MIATDGYKVFDSMGQFMGGGGDFINNDSITWEYGNDNAYSNSTIVLPKGNHQYYIFVATMSDQRCYKYFHNWNNDTFDFDEIRYSIIDMQANNGKGMITVKNKLLLKVNEYPYLNKTNFAACRHANGRDWWLLKPSARMRQVMHKILVMPDTIVCSKNNLPLLFNKWALDNAGQSAFSADGSLYAECNNFGPHTIYNFDRCNGELTLKRLIDMKPFKDTFGMAWDNSPKWRGLCFSPNGRFLYTCDPFNIYQLDLNEPNDTLAIRRVSKDSNGNTVFAEYSTMQLSPTGQIYLGNWHGLDSVIKSIPYPDMYGDSCGFNFKYVTTIGNTNDPPIMPFYGLGALKGSPCDTLNPPPPPPVPVFTSIKLYPNPVQDNLIIELPSNSKRYEMVIYNMLGEIVYRKKQERLTQFKFSISLGYLSKGTYTVKINTDKEEYRGKVVKE
jgi:hypothetical protein